MPRSCWPWPAGKRGVDLRGLPRLLGRMRMSRVRRVRRRVRMTLMRIPTLRRVRAVDPEAITGVARLDRRTKRLTGRLRPGDIAVIDHVDIDRVAADALVAVGVA